MKERTHAQETIKTHCYKILHVEEVASMAVS